jgi:hypothetical protein
MSDEFDCDIVASNNTDFIIADNIDDGKIPLLISGSRGPMQSDLNFNISDLLKEDTIFRTSLKKVFQTINELDKNKNFIAKSFSCIQNFLEEKLPLCDSRMLDERTACLFDDETFQHLVKNSLCMCVERAAMSQYICQQVGIKSHFVNSQVSVNNKKELHAYLIYEDKGNMYVYDPANPRQDKSPRILNANMGKLIYSDFIDAVEFKKDSNNVKVKKRVGFKAKDILNDDVFIYHSNCGIQGETITPSKLKARRNNNLKNSSSIEM